MPSIGKPGAIILYYSRSRTNEIKLVTFPPQLVYQQNRQTSYKANRLVNSVEFYAFLVHLGAFDSLLFP